MAGMLGFTKIDKIDVDYLIDTIDPLNLCVRDTIKFDKGILALATHDSPLKDNKYFNSEEWIIIISGDLIDYLYIPYEEIIKNLEKRNFDYFKNFNGIFSIAAYNQTDSKLILISDHLSIYPLYYLINKKGIYFSSNMATFSRLEKKLEFDENWLYEYIFFNYPIGDTTFFKEVKRMPAASILEIDLINNIYSFFEYADRFKKESNLISGDEALDLGLKIFSDRIPLYYKGDCYKLCSLTGGWDARTVFSLSPNSEGLLTYTYGIRGSSDLEQASSAAKSIDIDYEKIYFNKDFINNLPEYILETVFVSGGLQNILRSSLLYVYKHLFDKKPFPIFLNGIYFDNIYRGHMNFPSQISNQMMFLMQGNEIKFDDFKGVFKDESYNLFCGRISKKINSISKYGDPKETEFHLSYQLYETLKNYFGGEVAIANEFGTMRIPSIDTELINFAYSNTYSALRFSEFGGHKRGDKENILQALIISKNNYELSKTYVNGIIRPNTILKGNSYFLAYCNYKKILTTIKNKLSQKNDIAPLEDWNYWLNNIHKEFIDNLIFNKESKLNEHINKEYLEKIKKERDIQIIGKLTTIEIILRLIENKWERF